MVKTLAAIALGGGQGKTTTTLLLGLELAACGQRVLLVDCDAQANLSEYTATQPQPGEASTLELIKGTVPPADCVVAVSTHTNLWAIAADDALDQAQDYLAGTGIGALLLRKRLEPLVNDFDYCLVDTPPQRSQVVLTCLGSADAVVICSEAGVKGYGSLCRTLDLLEQQRNAGACSAVLLGVLPVRDRWVGRQRTSESQAAMDAFTDEVGKEVVLPSLRESVQVQRCVNRCERLSSDLSYPLQILATRLEEFDV